MKIDAKGEKLLQRQGLTNGEMESIKDIDFAFFDGKKKVKANKAEEILGKEVLFSGIYRAFHSGTAYRVVLKNKKRYVIQIKKIV